MAKDQGANKDKEPMGQVKSDLERMFMRRYGNFLYILGVAVLPGFIFSLFACDDRIADAPKQNLPPETHLFLLPDSELATTTSRQILHWWGDDADGRVIGFIYTFDLSAPEVATWGISDVIFPEWTFTESHSDTFRAPFRRPRHSFCVSHQSRR